MSDSPSSLSALDQAKQRATDLADKGHASSESELEMDPFVLIRSKGQWYAVDAHQVQRVVAKGPITRVPGHSRHIMGIALVQDTLVPIVDLATLTGADGPASQTEIAPRLVIVGHQEHSVGLVAEEAQGIEVLPRKLEGSPGGVIAGEVFWDERNISVVDVAALVAAGNDQRGGA